jgi:hypothetical protein
VLGGLSAVAGVWMLARLAFCAYVSKMNAPLADESYSTRVFVAIGLALFLMQSSFLATVCVYGAVLVGMLAETSSLPSCAKTTLREETPLREETRHFTKRHTTLRRVTICKETHPFTKKHHFTKRHHFKKRHTLSRRNTICAESLPFTKRYETKRHQRKETIFHEKIFYEMQKTRRFATKHSMPTGKPV